MCIRESSKDARARGIQLPGWNEALGLPKPWDQQWSLRFQQILAYETDLLEYPDIFNGSPIIEKKVKGLKKEAYKEIGKIEKMGGASIALENGYMKESLVASLSQRSYEIESGKKHIVGVNCYEETEESPLSVDASIQKVDENVARAKINSLIQYKHDRDENTVKSKLEKLKQAATNSENIMPISIECALAGITTGEWANTLRDVFGEYRPPTGTSVSVDIEDGDIEKVRKEIRVLNKKLGKPIKLSLIHISEPTRPY